MCRAVCPRWVALLAPISPEHVDNVAKEKLMSLPKLAVTLGSVAGIGPEITAEALLGHDEMRARCIFVVVGDERQQRAGACRLWVVTPTRCR